VALLLLFVPKPGFISLNLVRACSSKNSLNLFENQGFFAVGLKSDFKNDQKC
jgi:hypothetical protein